MSDNKRTRLNPWSQKLIETAGTGSRIGDQVIRYLENQLIETRNRSQVLKDWQTYTSLVKESSNPNPARFDEPDLTADERLFCQQIYYVLVVLLVAWSYLTRGTDMPADDIEMESLINGRAFEPMGIANLRLEGCPLNCSLEIKGMPDPLLGLLESIRKLDFGLEGDLFRPLYENLIPAKIRHAMGEHYTPEWLVRHMLDQVGFYGEKDETIIDPTCGSGVFLVEAISRKRSGQDYIDCWETVAGIDVNPLAVLAAKVNCLIASGYRVGFRKQLEIPVYQHDVILSDDEGLWGESKMPPGLTNYDYVVGNPPWINWESLSPEYRLATLDSWKKYGLFSHSGMDTILGKGKKDLSTLMTLVSADRLLKPQGKMAFLITQGVFKSGGAAEGFRAFTLPGGQKIKVLMVEDLCRLRPFASASNRTAILYLEKGRPTVYPVPYRLWTRMSDGKDKMHPRNEILDLMAEPVNQAELQSPWMTYGEGCREGLLKVMGASDYQAREGANTGGANGILWVEVIDRPRSGMVRIRNLTESSRKKIETVEAVIEDNLVYPLLKGHDVARWQVRPSAHIILTQDPLTRRGINLIVMARNFPRTLAYLQQFATELSNRAAYRRYFKKTDPFYSMFNVGEYTLAPYKTVWHRFGNRMKAAVVEGIERPVIPQETHTMVACRSREEAWYLAGILNSLPVEYAISSYSVVGGKNFAGPNLLNFIRIPLYTGSPLQDMVVQAAQSVSRGADPEILTKAVASMYGISDAELRGMKKGWEELGLKP
ncbi:MAG: HsdM family class I SAM-dependent methyltransferase [Syntrophomonadales bacterium]|jgi:hypothetical protein